MAAFTSAATSAGTFARFNRITRLAAGGRGSLAVSITVTSTGSLASTISQPWPDVAPDADHAVVQRRPAFPGR